MLASKASFASVIFTVSLPPIGNKKISVFVEEAIFFSAVET